jgi:hypothetical protein
MINPKFILNNAKSINQTSIKYYFYFAKTKFFYSLGRDFKIHPELWDNETQRPIDKKNSSPLKKKEVTRLLNKWSRSNPQIHLDLERIAKRQQRLIDKTQGYFSNQEIQDKEIDLNELRTIAS